MSAAVLLSIDGLIDELSRAHQAKVPIAVHLDHATDPEHIELALKLAEEGIAFDSIMVDASHADVRLFSSSSHNYLRCLICDLFSPHE